MAHPELLEDRAQASLGGLSQAHASATAQEAKNGRQTFIRGVGTATPSTRYTKAECLLAFRESSWYEKLDARARFVAHTVLERDNGIDERRLAVASLDDVFKIDADTLATRFLAHAPSLATDAALRAMADAGISAASIDAIVVSTCTGYLCPGLSGYVIERLGLRADVMAFDLVGQGCAAALPNLQLGHNLLRSGSCEHVLSVCVEVSSAAMYLDSDPGVVISACLFGDGAGAAVLSSQRAAPDAAANAKATHAPEIRWVDSTSLIAPQHRNALKFELRQGLLRNILTREVPALASVHAAQVLETVLQRSGLETEDIGEWIMHAGGRDVLRALERELGLDAHALRYSTAMLRQYGNLSSAFVYFVLEAARSNNPGGAGSAKRGWWWLSSFGAGFSCHGALLEVR
ncbi:MAG: putative naringenin-chalcone synthase [Hydrogenophaga sp.]|jgi:predicted naringenin-chalcone synthase